MRAYTELRPLKQKTKMPANLPSSIEFDARPRHLARGIAEGAGVVAAALVLESLPGLYRTVRDAHDPDRQLPEPFISELPGSSRAILLYSGCDQICEEHGERAAEVFGDIGHVIAPVYDKTISPSKLADQVTSTARNLGADELVVVGNSIGLGVSLQVAAERRFRKVFPELRGLLANAGVIEWSNIAPGPRVALAAAEVTGYSAAINKFYGAVRSHWPSNLPAPPMMRPSEIQRYAGVVARHLPDRCLEGLVDPMSTWFIDNLDAEGYEDRVALTKRTRENMARILGFEPQLVTDEQRPPHSHIANIAHFPSIPRQLVLSAFSQDARTELAHAS